jgi:hypothetical protein
MSDSSRLFLALLPPHISDPEISKDPGGDTTFEWGQGRWIVSLMYWAALLGKLDPWGRANLLLGIPKEVMALLDCWSFGSLEIKTQSPGTRK